MHIRPAPHIEHVLATRKCAHGDARAQAGLVNLTKLRQLDLTWNPDKCSGDLKLTGPIVSKVSEAYGDYSTVLAAQGVGRVSRAGRACRPVHMLARAPVNARPAMCACLVG